MDRRTTPANDRVAASHLRGQIEAERYVEGTLRQVAVPVTTILREPLPDNREREMLFGDAFRVLEDRDGFAFGQAAKDGYCGYVHSGDLGAVMKPTHIVSARLTHAYAAASIKVPPSMALSFGSRLTLMEEEGAFVRTHDGHYLPHLHVREIDRPFADPIAAAEMFLGTPYLWAGNSSMGIDCSGLVQTALLACGIPCPGDSDMQEEMLGQPLSEAVSTQRGDLFFWKRHVAMAVNTEMLIHANAGSMSVTYEPIATAIERIAASGGGPVTSRRRI